MVIALLGASALVVSLWVFWARAHSLERAAYQGLEDLISGNAEGLARLCLEEEFRGGEVLSDLRAVKEVVLDPALAGARPLKGVSVSSGVGSATATKWLMLRNGRSFPVSLQVFATEDGPRSRVVAAILAQGWQMRRQSTPGYSRRAGDLFRSSLIGLLADRDKLQRRGMRGLLMEPPLGFYTWDEFERHLLQVMSRAGWAPE